MHDLRATILHQLELDHEDRRFITAAAIFNLINVSGSVVSEPIDA